MSDLQHEEKNNGTHNSIVLSKGAKKKQKLALRFLEFILKYKNSAIFQWVNKNYVLSLVIVTVWGMIIVGIFLFMLIYNIMRYTSH